MKKICVFCGSNSGRENKYKDSAKEFGEMLAKNGFHLVYGGGRSGIMGVIADAVLESGGEVTGVIPSFLISKEVGHFGLTHLIEVGSMHERKQKMADLADGFVALPGGMGTLDELCEIITWAQLGLHTKPIGILNVNNYFDLLVQFFDKAKDEFFLSEANRNMILVSANGGELLKSMKKYKAPNVEKWLDSHRT